MIKDTRQQIHSVLDLVTIVSFLIRSFEIRTGQYRIRKGEGTNKLADSSHDPFKN